jgi:flagellar export protein FliJ
MRFHFPLEGLLHVRSLLEDQARDRLEQCMMRIGALEHSLAEAHEWSEKTARIRSSKKRLPATELQFIEAVLRQTETAIGQCLQQKQQEEERARVLRAAYLLARRDRKTVSTIRDNALRQYEIEQSRRLQSEMDEVFLGKLLHQHNRVRLAPTEASAEENQ